MGLTLITVLAFLIVKVNCRTMFEPSTAVRVYEHPKYKGKSLAFPDLQAQPFFKLDELNDKVSSVMVFRGTCAILYEHWHTTGRTLVIGYPQGYDIPNLRALSPNMEDIASKISQCGRIRKTHQCPAGTFVKRMSVHNHNMVSYFSIDCFLPSNKTHPSATLTSHPAPLPELKPVGCLGAVRGLSHNFSGEWREVYSKLQPHCTAQGTNYCANNQAICGILTAVEPETKLLKELSIRCCDVGDPGQFCDPKDIYVTILECNNLKGLSPMDCTWSQTVGNSTSTTAGESHSVSQQFYTEVGLEFGAAGSVLSASFSGKLGYSRTTGFNWASSSSQTWKVSTTATVKLVVPKCTKSILQQVIGSCSFFKVHVNMFKRIDTPCDGSRGERVSMMYGDDYVEGLQTEMGYSYEEMYE